mgnify:FL=1
MKRTLRAGPFVFRDPVLLCGVLYGLLWFDASGFLRIGLWAAFLHECGHVVAYLAMLHEMPTLEVNMTGFCMRTRGKALMPRRPAGGALGRETVRCRHHPGQRFSRRKPSDRGVQPSAHPAAGWGADGGGAVGAGTPQKEGLQFPAKSGKIKRFKNNVLSMEEPDV